MTSYPAYRTAKLNDLTNFAFQVSLQRAQKAHEFALTLQNNVMNERERAAWQDSLTNQETCLNGFRDLNLSATNPIRALLLSKAVNLSELVSNSLSMFKLSTLPPTTINNRRLVSVNNGDFDSHRGRESKDGFPEWLFAGDRKLLQASSPASQTNSVVPPDGSGNYRTIAEAINAVPEQISKRYIDISNKITNLMLVGDGKDKTVVTGSKSVQNGVTTLKTATVAVSGNGFVARDMTLENTVGAEKHQAVALRVGSDQLAVYRPVQHQRLPRHFLSASSDLEAVKGSIKTYLGRPWREYSRTVSMQSTLGDHIDPAGWLEWNGNFALSTLYFGEYSNTGDGAGTSKRVNWPVFHVISSATEAAKLTVAQLISGTSWIPVTGVAYTSRL
ncbi:hypothetical protein SUGI_0648210 [Cryptomeria japonica]|nr:hypothetical protein SUGI_0648210 [Cryptomeria japonica]